MSIALTTIMVSNQTDFLVEFNDFSEVFDNIGLRICWGFIMMTELTFSNAFNFFFIMFDKYGEDSLKRSLNNQLIRSGSCHFDRALNEEFSVEF